MWELCETRLRDGSTGRTAVVRTRMPGGVGGAASRGAHLSRSASIGAYRSRACHRARDAAIGGALFSRQASDRATVDRGTRVDRRKLVVAATHGSPRITFAFHLGAGFVLYAWYNHFFIPPPIEGVLSRQWALAGYYRSSNNPAHSTVCQTRGSIRTRASTASVRTASRRKRRCRQCRLDSADLRDRTGDPASRSDDRASVRVWGGRSVGDFSFARITR